MIFNIGTNEPTYNFTVTGYSGAKVTITNGKDSFTKTTGNDGSAVFEKLSKGIWQVTATDGNESVSYEVQIGRDSSNTLNLNAIPSFLYNGTSKIVDDNDNVITQSLKNWKIKFLTSGTLNLTNLNGATGGIDVFCVGGGGNGGNGSLSNDVDGGGGGGGGGGYTTAKRGLTVKTGTYDVYVGGSGGKTSAFGVSANGGGNGGSYGGNGGDGGSGGGAGTWSSNVPANGGTNGSNGSAYATLGGNAGKGQGNPPGTREFHESNGKLYSSGGKGGTHGNYSTDRTTAENTGNGGNGGNSGSSFNATERSGIAGGSGIVIIRNKR
jgi:hypothetical protein